MGISKTTLYRWFPGGRAKSFRGDNVLFRKPTKGKNMKLAKTVLVKVERFQGCLKKGAFGETLYRGPVSGPTPPRSRAVLLSQKTVSHIAAALR